MMENAPSGPDSASAAQQSGHLSHQQSGESQAAAGVQMIHSIQT